MKCRTRWLLILHFLWSHPLIDHWGSLDQATYFTRFWDLSKSHDIIFIFNSTSIRQRISGTKLALSSHGNDIKGAVKKYLLNAISTLKQNREFTMLGTKTTIQGFLRYNTENKDIFNGISSSESMKRYIFFIYSRCTWPV